MIQKEIEQYIERHTTPEDDVLYKLNRTTHLKTFYPNMLSGHVQGKFLEMISHMIRPEYILEIGTFTGYSAICLVKGLSEGGKLITLESNEEMESFASEFINLSGMHDRIELIMGNALQIIPGLKEKFDLVFIDADKEQYVDYYELILPKVRNGGFILADNVLWGGKTVYDNKPDKETQGIRRFNEKVKNDPRVEQVMLSIRDGLMLIRKIRD
ncbi:MAG: O-methyltransferase [Chlorobi bacterium]|nr:O-methyltransferase [Chlorobiota bacterium]